MKPVFDQTIVLKALLGKFINILFISNDELETMQDFILCSIPAVCTVPDNSEIYETLVYLRDLAEENNFKSIDELYWYFETQQSNLNKMIEPYLTGEEFDDKPEFVNHPFGPETQTTNEKLLTWTKLVHDTNPDRLFLENLYQNVNVDYTSNALASSYKKLNLAAYCFNRIVLFHERYFRKSILPNNDPYYYKNYFEDASLSSRLLPGFVFMIKGLKYWFWLLRNDYRKLGSIVSGNKKRKKRLKSFYEKIFDSIRSEKIDSEPFKSAVSRIMLTSKMNSPQFMQHLRACRTEKENYSEEKDNSGTDFCTKIQFYRGLSEKKWSVLKSPAGCDWITSDNPGFSFDYSLLTSKCQHIDIDPYLTVVDARRLVYFPLSKDYCLRLEPFAFDESLLNGIVESSVSIQMSSQAEVTVVNNFIVSSKPDVIISAKGIQMLQEEECR